MAIIRSISSRQDGRITRWSLSLRVDGGARQRRWRQEGGRAREVDEVEEVRGRGAEVSFTAVRRQGITGRQPEGGTELREGDIVVIYGTPEALEHAEAVLLAG